jgi:hypothetical protein
MSNTKYKEDQFVNIIKNNQTHTNLIIKRAAQVAEELN